MARPHGRSFLLALTCFAAAAHAQAPSSAPSPTRPANESAQISTAAAPSDDFQVVELRRYTLIPGERRNFARYFETWFPEAFQQLGALAFGEFFDRRDPDTFTWLRGFHDMDERARANQAFYDGPVWKEHKALLNDRLVDHTDVLLLTPLERTSGVAVLPSLDPAAGTGASGIVVAQVFRAAPGHIGDLVARARPVFADYRVSGVRAAGVLVTLDAPNNFPALPFRTDGPYLVWLGIVRDAQMLEALRPLLQEGAAVLGRPEWLRGTPELMVLDPAPRSRLRWVP